MIAKVYALGRSFEGAVRPCLHPVSHTRGGRLLRAHRVEWADTRNLASRPELAAAQMSATTKAAPHLKRLASVSPGGRPLEKPVLHYALYWPTGQRPAREEMGRAAAETLTVLGLDSHQALLLAHSEEGQPHLHVIANRVHPLTGKAANLHNAWLTLSRWAHRWERAHGGVRCPGRLRNHPGRSS